jgi:RimJ/RimL family protein N-acetyltransferase
MRSQHIPMTIEEFRRVPRKLGWKYEYWDGQTHISPSHQIVTVSIEVKPRAVTSLCQLRAVNQADAPHLSAIYFVAFSNTIEYCDWKPEEIQETAREDVHDFFAGKRGKPHPASRIAVAPDEDSVVGAALIVENEDGTPFLDILFVTPEWQHQGVGTALVSSAINELYQAGVKRLESSYMLGNEESQAWHRKFGFVEVPDLFLARWYYRHAQYELRRREQIGDLTSAEHDKLSATVNQWKAEVDELERIAEQKGMEAVLPILRR